MMMEEPHFGTMLLNNLELILPSLCC